MATEERERQREHEERTISSPRYGRFLDEFEIGAVYDHPVGGHGRRRAPRPLRGELPRRDRRSTRARTTRAALGFRDRPVHPLALLNFGLSFSVHDVSRAGDRAPRVHRRALPERVLRGRHAARVEHRARRQAVARGRARRRPRAHRAAPAEDEPRRLPVRAQGAREGARRRGRRRDRVGSGSARPPEPGNAEIERRPLAVGLRSARSPRRGKARLPRLLRGLRGGRRHLPRHRPDGERGRAHAAHVRLPEQRTPCTSTSRTPASGFAKTRVVYGGLVFGWVASLASRDTSGNALWEAGFDNGAHPAGVVAGDTLYAASKVLKTSSVSPGAGLVTFKLVGTKNVKPSALLDDGADLFTDELSKKEPAAGEGAASGPPPMRR